MQFHLQKVFGEVVEHPVVQLDFVEGGAVEDGVGPRHDGGVLHVVVIESPVGVSKVR